VRKQKNKVARNSVIVLPYQINLLKDILRIIDASSKFTSVTAFVQKRIKEQIPT
jgi:hypothetical protein